MIAHDANRSRSGTDGMQMRMAFIWLAVAALLSPAGQCAGDSADISLPASVSFMVTDVNWPTVGSPDPTTISFSNASLTAGYSLRMSIKAADQYFTRPGETGDRIEAFALTWVTLGAINGAGYAGVMSHTSYTRVYQSSPDATSGSANVTWTLNAIGEGIRAGDHVLAATWKVESL